jgi:hypothetical protein
MQIAIGKASAGAWAAGMLIANGIRATSFGAGARAMAPCYSLLTGRHERAKGAHCARPAREKTLVFNSF